MPYKIRSITQDISPLYPHLFYQRLLFLPAYHPDRQDYLHAKQRNTVAVIIVAALMHKPTRRPVLAVVHVGAFTVHYPAPFRAPARALKSAQCYS